jgi:hypothetical protein
MMEQKKIIRSLCLNTFVPMVTYFLCHPALLALPLMTVLNWYLQINTGFININYKEELDKLIVFVIMQKNNMSKSCPDKICIPTRHSGSGL